VSDQLQQENHNERTLTPKKRKVILLKQQVWEMTMQGFTQEQIAKEFRVSTKTISRAIHEIKKDSVRWMDTLPKGQLQIYHRANVESMEKVSMELWKLLEKTEDDDLKFRILIRIPEIRKKMSSLLEGQKVVELSETLHEKISPTINPRDVFDEMPPRPQEINYDNL